MNKIAEIVVVSSFLAFCSIGFADDLHVPNPYPTIQSAIDAAIEIRGDTVIVAPGTYTGDGNWDISFLGKAITVRSENGPNDCIIDCNDVIDYWDGYVEYFPHLGFSFGNNEDANSVLDGFTITNCHWFGAIQCWGSPTIKNCIITGNSGYDGGGITCYGGGSPVIADCTISDNTGSGIYCGSFSSPVITNCTITGNTGSGPSFDTYGGGIYCWNSSLNPRIINCKISGNYAGYGGGVFCDGGNSKPVITSCALTDNSALYDGGGICCRGSLALTIIGCTITNNLAKGYGGGIYGLYGSVTNSIVWSNVDSDGTGQSTQIYSGNPNVWFSCIKDDNPNDANIPYGADKYNIDDDPCFVDGDYHLLPTSPCIEAGDYSFTYHVGDVDIDGQPRRMGLCIDMGADEFDTKMIVVTKPKGEEVWTGGSTHEVTWDSYGITGTVDISYSINNGVNWTKIANVPNTGSFIWELPTSQFPWLRHNPPIDSNRCLVSVEPHTPVPDFIRIGSGPFTIQPYRNWPPQPWWLGCPRRELGPRYGCVKWQFQTGGSVNAGVAIGLSNRVHVPCEDGKLYTLNPAGKLIWTYDTNSPLVCSPAVDSSGNVYVGAENGKLYAIDKFGRLLWTHTTNGPVYSSPVVLFDDLPCGCPRPFRKAHSSPWQQQVQIFVGSVDGALYALGQDGSELWSFETDSVSAVTTGAIFASPAISCNGALHIAGIYDPNLYAIDLTNEDIKWNLAFPNPHRQYSRKPWPFASPVIAKDGTIYQVLLYDPNLYAINPNDGSIIWSTNMADPCSGWFEPNYAQTYGPAACWSKPALAPNGTIYVNLNDPYLRAVDPNGTIKWVAKLGTVGGFTLAVGADGLIYAASDDARLYVVDRNGQQVSQFEGFGALSFPTITTGRVVLISDANNTVWAIGQNNCWGQPLALHQPVE